MGLKDFIIRLAPIPLVKLFASPHVAGDSIEAAVEAARLFWDSRRVTSTIDLLGEELTSDEEVEYTVDVYSRLIDAMGPQEYATISLKPTQLGSHRGTEHCTEIIERIVAQAEKSKIKVTLYSFGDYDEVKLRNAYSDIKNRVDPRYSLDFSVVSATKEGF